MVNINKIQVLAELNKEMLGAVSKLEGVVEKGDQKGLDEMKKLILNLQKKISGLL